MSRTSDFQEAGIEELRAAVALLSLRVQRLGEEVAELRGVERESVGSFEVVPEPAPAAAAASSEVSGAFTWTYRESIAREIGQWLRETLAGRRPGASGREKLRGLQNRIYLVVRDYEGEVYRDPVLVLTAFNRVRALCARGGDWGDSIFIGLPTQREGSIAAAEAGLRWPLREQ